MIDSGDVAGDSCVEHRTIEVVHSDCYSSFQHVVEPASVAASVGRSSNAVPIESKIFDSTSEAAGPQSSDGQPRM